MHRICARAPGTQEGFTLIEMMIVVAIIGVLASIAIPQFLGMRTQSKRSEAELNLDAIKKGLKAGLASNAGFVAGSAALTPAEDCCDSGRNDRKCAPTPEVWTTSPEWSAIGFSIDEPHYYRYGYEGSEVGPEQVATAIAVGDLDCDGVFATYELRARFGGGDPSYDLVRPARAD